MAMKNYEKAIPDFVFIMSLQPKNKEVNADLQFCRNQVKGTDRAKLQITELVEEGEERVKIETVEHDPEEEEKKAQLKAKTRAPKQESKPPVPKQETKPPAPKQEFKRIQIEEDSSDEDEEEEAKPSEETSVDRKQEAANDENPS